MYKTGWNVANVAENIERTHPQPPDPGVKREPLPRIREKCMMEERQNCEKARSIEASIPKKNMDPKLNGEQRPLGFGTRQFAEQKNPARFVPPSQVFFCFALFLSCYIYLYEV